MFGEIVSVKVGGERVEISVEETLSIDRGNLDDSLARQAALYARIAILHEHARAERTAIEAELDEISAALFDVEKSTLTETGDVGKLKTPTDAVVRARVKTNKKVSNLAKQARKAEESERLLGALERALSQRKDLVVALARARSFELSTPTGEEVDRIKKNLGLG